MGGSEFCYYHRRVHEGPRLLFPTLIMLEDAHGVQAALMEVLCAVVDGSVDQKLGALLLYGLQTAASNLKRIGQVDPEQVTTEAAAPAERLPEGVFERKRDEWSGEEKGAIKKFMYEMEDRKLRRQVEEERNDAEWQAHIKRTTELRNCRTAEWEDEERSGSG
jgi:hypothetical protein